jgi:PTH2 family peptidyl-tRNA hydrolase
MKTGRKFTPLEEEWLDTGATKICVRAESEEELLDVAKKAIEEGVPCYIVQDEGRTEFNGQKTLTCLALGPDRSSKIDKISGDLKLL